MCWIVVANYNFFQQFDIRFTVVSSEITLKIFRYRKMSPEYIIDQHLISKQGREALHFDELWFVFALIVDAYTEVKSNKMGMLIFIWNFQCFGDRIFRQLFERRIRNNVYNALAGM